MQLDVSHLSIALGKEKKLVLQDVSFTAPDGCFMSLLGPSGAGKSTLLKVLAGTLTADEGTIKVDNDVLDDVPAHKRNLGFVYQDVRLFPHMTVEENVAFGLKVRGVDKTERAKRVSEILERVQLGGMEKRGARELSGGQAQRVALARTLICEPRVLLLDEPFSGLDELLRDDMRSLVLSLHREMGITTIMVTHDAIEALELSDRIVYLEGGRVLQQGTPRELFETPASPEVAASFGDSSTIHGEISDGQFRCADLCIELDKLGHGVQQCPNHERCDTAHESCGTALEARNSTRDTDSSTFNESSASDETINISNTSSARAVIRFESVDIEPHAGFFSVGKLPVRCGVYRGKECLTRFELDGQVLTVPTEKVLPAGEYFEVFAQPSGVFVYK